MSRTLVNTGAVCAVGGTGQEVPDGAADAVGQQGR